MKKREYLIIVILLGLLPAMAVATESYAEIASRYPANALDQSRVQYARMQGDCLASIKGLNFKRLDHFDPIAEWSSLRSLSLLEQFPPCEVLIMLTVAQQKLRTQEAQ